MQRIKPRGMPRLENRGLVIWSNGIRHHAPLCLPPPRHPHCHRHRHAALLAVQLPTCDTAASPSHLQAQHGFARNMAWQVAEEGPASCRLVLESDESTLAQWPHPFRLEMAVSRLGGGWVGSW